eukprot:4363171-Pyramimonas_sp.AAC.1
MQDPEALRRYKQEKNDEQMARALAQGSPVSVKESPPKRGLKRAASDASSSAYRNPFPAFRRAEDPGDTLEEA